MASVGVSPTRTTIYGSLLTALTRAGNLEQAEIRFIDLIESGLEMAELCFGPLVLAYAKRGDVANAEE